MSCKFSKLMRNALILNFILALIAMGVHGYSIHKTNETNDLVIAKMAEKQVIRETAVRMLQKEGYELSLGFSSAMFSMCNVIASLIALYMYTQSHSFLAGFMASFFSVFTSFIGGFLLFYILLSGKSERKNEDVKYSNETDWEVYIHNKAAVI